MKLGDQCFAAIVDRLRALGKITSILILGLIATVATAFQLKAAPAAKRLEPVIKLGHSSLISALAISPNGHYLATSSSDRTVRLWDIQSGVEIRAFRHASSVGAVAFLNDDQVVSGTSEGVLQVWSIQTGLPLTNTKVGGSVKRLFTAPSGTELWCDTIFGGGIYVLDAITLQVIANDETSEGVAVARSTRSDGSYAIARWSAESLMSSRSLLRVGWWSGPASLRDHTEHELDKKITTASLTSDGLNLLLGTEDGVIHRLYGAGLSAQARHPGHSGAVKSIDISPDGTRFVSAGDDSVVLVRAMETGEKIKTFESQDRSFSTVLFTADGNRFLAATDEHYSARLVDLSSQTEMLFGGSVQPVINLELSRDNRYLLAGAWYGAHLWDLLTGKMTQQFDLSGNATATTISPEGNRIFTGESLPHDYSHYLVAKDVKTGKELGRFPHRTSITAAIYSPDRKLLATGESTGKIHIWSTETGREVGTLVGHSGTVQSIAFGIDKTLLSSAADSTARVWDLETGEERWREDAAASADVFSSDGRLLAAWRGTLKVFDVTSHALLAQIDDAWSNFAFVADGKTLLFVNDESRTLEAWDSVRHERRRVYSVNDPHAVKVIPLPGTLVLVCEQSKAMVIDWAKGRLRHELQDASCSSTGAPFVIINRKGRREVWDAVTRNRRSLLQEEADFYEDRFSVSADNRFMVTANGDFFIDVWDIDNGRTVRREDDDYLRIDSLRSSLPALAANLDRYFVSSHSDKPPETAINEWVVGGADRPRRIFTQPYAANSLDISRDGERLVICAGDGVLRVVSSRTGELLAQREDSSCHKARFSGDGSLIITTGLADKQPPQVWSSYDISSRIPGIDYRPTNVVHFAVSEGGQRILTGGEDGRLHLWDLVKGEEVNILPQISLGVRSVEFAMHGLAALIGTDTGEIRSWLLGADGVKAGITYAGHQGPVSLVRRAPNDDSVFLSVGDDGTVRVWSVYSSTAERVLGWPDAKISTAMFSPDGSLVGVGDSDRSFRIWDVAAGRLLYTLNMPSVARSAAFDPNKGSVTIGSDDGVVRVFDYHNGKPLLEVRPPEMSPIISVGYIGEFLITGTRAGTSIWSHGGELLVSFTAGAPIAASKMFINSSGDIGILNAGQGVHLGYLGGVFGVQPTELFSESVYSVATSQDGLQVAAGFFSGWVRIWNLSTSLMVSAFRVSDSEIKALKYSRDGRFILLVDDKRAPEMWDVSTGSLVQKYGDPHDDINDLEFAGTMEQFVVSASGDGRVRVFARDTGDELCTLLSYRNGDWLAVRSDGLFDGSEGAFEAIGWRFEDSPELHQTKALYSELHRPGLLAQILRGEISPPPAFSVSISPPASTIELARPKQGELPPSLQEELGPRPPVQGSASGLYGEGLRQLISLFAGILNAGGNIDLNDGFRLETLPNGRIEVGLGALEQLFQGRSWAASIGLLAFIIGHEVVHSRQAAEYQFGDLSLEDKRLLECEADILGTIDAIKLIGGVGSSQEGLEAYAAIRLSQESVSAMQTLEGVDSSHPTQSQRQWAVDFGNARMAARSLEEETDRIVLDRRFDALGHGEDNVWARAVCKRILNHREANQSLVRVELRDEHKIGDRWGGQIVYTNRSEVPLKISAHIRLVGTASSPLTGELYDSLQTIDGYVTSFVLPPGGERIEPVSFGVLELRFDRLTPSGILYTSVQQGNWMSVEVAEEAPSSPLSASSSTASIEEPVSTSALGSSPTCLQSRGKTESLNSLQRELAGFLFKVASHASDGFKRLRRGNPVVLGGVLDAGTEFYKTDIFAPGAKESAKIVRDDDGVRLTAVLGDRLERSEAAELFNSTSSQLLAICPKSPSERQSFPAPGASLALEVFKISEFARNVEVVLQWMENRSQGESEVTLTVQVRKGQ